MEKAKTYLELLLVLAAALFLVAIGTGVAVDVFWASDPKAPEAFRGGFIGAFFAFLFVRAGDFLSKLFERSRRNSQLLLTLQHRYVEVGETLSNNRHLLEFWNQLAAPRSPQEGIPLWTNRLHMAEVPRDLIVELI